MAHSKGSRAALAQSAKNLHFETAGKVLFEALNRVFDQDPNIIELGLMLCTQEPPNSLSELVQLLDDGLNNSELEPARSVVTNHPFIHKDHRIGLSFWCLPLLYQYAYTTLINLDRNDTDPVVLKDLTRAILLINADCMTAWNVRKDLMCKRKNEMTWEETALELQFMNLVGTKHPKSCESWDHRTWILHNVLFCKDSRVCFTKESFLSK